VKKFILSTIRLTSFSVRLTCPSGRPLPFGRLSLRGYPVADAGDGEGGRERGEGERDEGEGLGDVLASSGDKYCDLSIGERCAIEGFDLVGGEEYVLCAERLGDEDEDEWEFVLDFLADGELEPIEI
jgi:hypothetical protein